MKRVLAVILLALTGCVSKKTYLEQGEALARSLSLNQRCIQHAEALEVENKDLRDKNNRFQGVYGDALRIEGEVKKSGKLK